MAPVPLTISESSGEIKMKFQNSYSLLFTVMLAVSGCGSNSAPDAVSAGSPSGQTSTKSVVVDGSSTVFRISKAAQIAFAESNPDIDVVVESHGTGGGFGRYFQGEVDIIDASREAKPEEASKATGEFAWSRYLVAHDGITVVVNPKNDFVNELSVADLKKLWEPDSKVKSWKDLNPAWPDRKISLYSPDKDSGTFEYFTEAINKKARAQRDDIQASPDDNTLVRGISGDADAIGYFGFAYYMANATKVKAVKVKGEKGDSVMPSKESILSGSYEPLSRPLYIYVKNAASARSEVSSFVKYYLSNVSMLAEKAGYVSPTEAELKSNAATLAGGEKSASTSASEPKTEAK
jgi:phosphate transport system substrate-binding protein